MFWRDVYSDIRDGTWLGLEGVLHVTQLRAHLHVQAGERFFIRLMTGPWPLMWARIAPDYYGYWYLRSDLTPRPPDLVLPPFTAAGARSIEGPLGTAKWYSAWARVFLSHLEGAARSPLHSGHWLLAPCVGGDRREALRATGERWPIVPPAIDLEHTLSQKPHDYSDWSLGYLSPLALRGATLADDGRVKSWRKGLREGYFPPVLLMWVSGLDRYVVLDGHDRLHAALLEGRVPPILALLSVRELGPRGDGDRARAVADKAVSQIEAATAAHAPRDGAFSVESVNKLLTHAYDDRPRMSLRTMAWPLAGGVHSWLRQVRSGLDRLPPGLERDLEMTAAPTSA